MLAVMKVLMEDEKARWDALIGKRMQTGVLLKASPHQGIISGMQSVIGDLLPALPITPPPLPMPRP